jgi:hypothetical protein
VKFCIVWLVLLGLVTGLKAQTLKIQEVLPGTLRIEAGGRQIHGILRGENLQLLKEARVMQEGRMVNTFFLRLGLSSENRREFTLLASPQCQLGGGYQVEGVLFDGSSILWPMNLTVVPLGDTQATPTDTASLEESAQIQSGQRIVVSANAAPTITGTIPSPLAVIQGGQSHKLIIQGKNLQGITEVRIRKSDREPKYRGNQGLVPFRHVPQGLEIEVTAGAGTPVGSKFVVDLMVKKYLAASALLAVKSSVEEIPTVPGQ